MKTKIKRDVLSSRVIKELVSHSDSIHLSAYMPLEKEPSSSSKNDIRLRNFIAEIKTNLEKRINQESINRFATCIEALRKELPQWHQTTRSIAIFISLEECRLVELQVDVEPFWTTGLRYYLKPLLAIETNDSPFYALRLDRQNTRLYFGNLHGISEVEVPGMPRSLEELTQFDEQEPSLQQHTNSSDAGSAPVMARHGQSSLKDKASSDEKAFNHAVARAVSQYLSGDKCTVILVGDKSNLGHFERAVNLKNHTVYPHYQNPNSLSEEEFSRLCRHNALHNTLKTRQILIRDVTSSRYEATGVDSIHEALEKAREGALECAVVASNKHALRHAGTDLTEVGEDIDELSGELTEDLLDYIAQKTIAHGGKAIAVDSQDIVGANLVLAKARY